MLKSYAHIYDVYLSSSFSLYLITSLAIKSGISTASQGPNYNRTNIKLFLLIS